MSALTRSRLHAILLAFVFFAVVAFAYSLGMRVADAATDAPGPSSQLAIATADTAWDLVEQHGPIWGGMLLVFGIGTVFVRRNEKDGWLKQGRVLAIVVGAVGVLGSVLEAALNGGTWAGVIVTAFAAIKLVLSPTVAPTPAKPVLPVSMVVLLLGVLTLGACKLPGPVPVVADATIDCLGEHRPQIDELLTELTPLVFLQSPDWSAVYQRAKQAGKDVGGCVIAELVQRYLAPAPGTGRTAPSIEASWPAHDALERFRRDEAGGATFHTAYGEL
jgi:hypothetical protein